MFMEIAMWFLEVMFEELPAFSCDVESNDFEGNKIRINEVMDMSQ